MSFQINPNPFITENDARSLGLGSQVLEYLDYYYLNDNRTSAFPDIIFGDEIKRQYLLSWGAIASPTENNAFDIKFLNKNDISNPLLFLTQVQVMRMRYASPLTSYSPQSYGGNVGNFSFPMSTGLDDYSRTEMLITVHNEDFMTYQCKHVYKIYDGTPWHHIADYGYIKAQPGFDIGGIRMSIEGGPAFNVNNNAFFSAIAI